MNPGEGDGLIRQGGGLMITVGGIGLGCQGEG